jgi:hypothetical protein
MYMPVFVGKVQRTMRCVLLASRAVLFIKGYVKAL